MAVVELRNLTKTYERTTASAVTDINLRIEDGEFMVLLGPSGCGKSTTLRMIAGLESITSGELLIDGKVVNKLAAKDRDIAMVFQSYALYPHMTVRDNLGFGLRRRGISGEEVDRRVLSVAEMLGLSSLLVRKPASLSGGQRQRVALGRAIVREPKVFLFDEPLSNLDSALRANTRKELIKQHQTLGATIIYVTHDQVEAMTMGQRICILNQGRVVQVGLPLDIYRHPANTFVAGFLGTPPMNLFQVKILSRENGFFARLDAYEVPLIGFEKQALQELVNQPATLGIRPENFILTEESAVQPSQSVCFDATVSVIEALGAETVVIVNSNTQPKFEFSVRVGPLTKVKVGERIDCRFDLAAVHLFDGESGVAVARASSH